MLIAIGIDQKQRLQYHHSLANAALNLVWVSEALSLKRTKSVHILLVALRTSELCVENDPGKYCIGTVVSS